MRRQNLYPTSDEVAIVRDELPAVMTTCFRQQAIVEIVCASLEVCQDLYYIGGGKWVVMSCAELQHSVSIRSRALADRLKFRRLAEHLEVRVNRLVQGIPFNAAIAVQILAKNHARL